MTSAKHYYNTHSTHSMKLILPAILNPISRRKDKSVKLSLETRELTPTETIELMALEGSEGWIMFAPNEEGLEEKDMPHERAEVGVKTPSEELRAVIMAHYHQEVEAGLYIGLKDNFYKEQMQKIKSGYISKNLRN